MNKTVFVIVGPTASGKSDIAELFHKKYGFEMINADAYQIYKQMNIGTAKIAKDDPYYRFYHLLDIKNVGENYSVFNYQKDCRNALNGILSRSNGAIIVGGTGLYIKASLYDFNFEEQEETNFDEISKMSNQEIYDELKKLDPLALEKIHINNRKRLIRALDIALNNKDNKSSIIQKQRHELVFKDVNFEFIFINPLRDALYERINARVDWMIKKGLEEEALNLFNNFNVSLTASQAIGYKEFFSYFNKEITYEECIELIKKRSRNYAKRQITYFTHQLPCKEFKSIEEVKKYYEL